VVTLPTAGGVVVTLSHAEGGDMDLSEGTQAQLVASLFDGSVSAQATGTEASIAEASAAGTVSSSAGSGGQTRGSGGSSGRVG
jgi:hypothetical protein